MWLSRTLLHLIMSGLADTSGKSGPSIEPKVRAPRVWASSVASGLLLPSLSSTLPVSCPLLSARRRARQLAEQEKKEREARERAEQGLPELKEDDALAELEAEGEGDEEEDEEAREARIKARREKLEAERALAQKLKEEQEELEDEAEVNVLQLELDEASPLNRGGPEGREQWGGGGVPTIGRR